MKIKVGVFLEDKPVEHEISIITAGPSNANIWILKNMKSSQFILVKICKWYTEKCLWILMYSDFESLKIC